VLRTTSQIEIKWNTDELQNQTTISEQQCERARSPQMNGLSMIFWSMMDWLYAIAHDRNQRWEADCLYCEKSYQSRSYNMILLKDSLHVEFAEDDLHPSREEMTSEEWSTDSKVEPRLVRGTTHLNQQ